MRKTPLILFICLFLLAGWQSTKVALFNGKNLDGWVNYGSEKWYVEDGLLICESGPKAEYGYLGTENPPDALLYDRTIQVICSEMKGDLGHLHAQHYPVRLDMSKIVQKQPRHRYCFQIGKTSPWLYP